MIILLTKFQPSQSHCSDALASAIPVVQATFYSASKAAVISPMIIALVTADRIPSSMRPSISMNSSVAPETSSLLNSSPVNVLSQSCTYQSVSDTGCSCRSPPVHKSNGGALGSRHLAVASLSSVLQTSVWALLWVSWARSSVFQKLESQQSPPPRQGPPRRHRCERHAKAPRRYRRLEPSL